jgi:uncharacterized protein (DUF1499 family)
MNNAEASRASHSRIALAGFWMGLIAIFLLLIAGPGYRMHWWDLKTGLLRFIPAALFLGIAAIVVSIIGLFAARNKTLAAVGLILGLIAAGLPASNIATAKHSPIHDVSTDMANPPQFSAVLPARAAVPHGNPVEYDSKTAELQRETYPDIGPLHLNVPPNQAFDRALTAGRAMGWEIIASDPAQLRIEATATTFWFGFKDDVVVRITPENEGSSVDVRSLSRIGQSDVGANARRVRDYLGRLKKA